jgi:aspartate racemase
VLDHGLGTSQGGRVKKIGLLGGMSWESTALYYSLLNQLVRERLGGYHSARCLLASVDFAPIEEMQRAGDWEAAGRLLAAEAQALEYGGAELLLLCTNTMHKVADRIEEATSVPFVHLADVTARAVLDADLQSVAFLGTGFSMRETFHTDRIAGHGLEVTVPDAEGQQLVHDVIYDELVHGVVRDESRAAYRRIIESLVARGAQGVILGCTEIELLIGPDDCPVPTFPTTRLHVEAAVDLALAG